MTQNITTEVIVAGVGGMGSAACYHLANRGVKVVGIEQFGVAHDRGSSHGDTRLIRLAYFEYPDYVPLLQRSFGLWEKLSKETGRQLLHRTGLILYGKLDGGKVLPGVLEAAAKHNIKIFQAGHSDAMEKFPQFTPPAGYSTAFETKAGYLEVENCVGAYATQAKKTGSDNPGT